jgi:hypothetical protein
MKHSLYWVHSRISDGGYLHVKSLAQKLPRRHVSLTGNTYEFSCQETESEQECRARRLGQCSAVILEKRDLVRLL